MAVLKYDFGRKMWGYCFECKCNLVLLNLLKKNSAAVQFCSGVFCWRVVISLSCSEEIARKLGKKTALSFDQIDVRKNILSPHSVNHVDQPVGKHIQIG